MLRVDNIPWYLKPFFLVYGYGGGLIFYLYGLLMHATCKIKFTGSPMPTSAAAFCIWHKDLALYFIVFTKVKKQVWMNHPAWYMKPVHVTLHLNGVEHICLGSSGNSGKAALQKVIGYLKQGYSTTVACDGPAGPPLELKPGILFMSRDAQVPVVPLRFSSNKSKRIGGWDKKIIPALFSEIIVDVGQPVFVSDENFEQSASNIKRHLDASTSLSMA
jgi:lysophospholipid acyltransferase (LPLAT)-like uncharacterized protein